MEIELPEWTMGFLDWAKIISNNALLGTLLLFGFLTFNISNVTLVVFNGLFYGATFDKLFARFGNLKFLAFIIPHGLIELIAFSVLFSCSIDINISLYHFLCQKRDDFIDRKTIKCIALSYILLLVASWIEVWLSPLLIKAL